MLKNNHSLLQQPSCWSGDQQRPTTNEQRPPQPPTTNKHPPITNPQPQPFQTIKKYPPVNWQVLKQILFMMFIVSFRVAYG